MTTIRLSFFPDVGERRSWRDGLGVNLEMDNRWLAGAARCSERSGEISRLLYDNPKATECQSIRDKVRITQIGGDYAAR